MKPELEDLYNEYQRKVMGYIRARVTRWADAEDLCSKVFEKVYLKLESFDETKASVSTWIFTITRNTVIDYFRHSRPTEELDENLSDSTELDENLLNSESLSELAEALRALPEEMRDMARIFREVHLGENSMVTEMEQDMLIRKMIILL